jgi:hypothetical protein
MHILSAVLTVVAIGGMRGNVTASETDRYDPKMKYDGYHDNYIIRGPKDVVGQGAERQRTHHGEEARRPLGIIR